MQNINPKLLEALKQKNVHINLNYVSETSSSQQKVQEKQSQADPNSIDPANSLGTTASKFRVRSMNPSNQEEAMMRSTFNKTTGKFLARPTTASRNETITPKNVPSHNSLPLSRPVTAMSGNSNNSLKGPLVKSDSTRLSEDDGDNAINFINMDDENELDEKFREELEVFNDIADLNEEKLAGILNIDIETVERINKVEMKVDLSFNSLQQAGGILKNLKQLKLNNSIINSLRDIGNTFVNLEILWVSKCGMKDLAGLSSFPQLQELYASYNNIKDLSDIIYHTNLQVLDLEGNEIEACKTLENLSSITQLANLTVSSNPLCSINGYEQQILNMLPQLLYLNDEPRDSISSEMISNKKLDKQKMKYLEGAQIQELYSKVQKLDLFSVEDFDAHIRQAIKKEMAKEPSEEDIITMSVKKSSQKAKLNLQDSDDLGKFSMKASTKKMTQRPQTSKARFGSKSNSLFADNEKQPGSSHGFSDLVHQTDQAFAGNPLKALRHRRKNQFTAGFENIQGENLAKPKDILKLIEEFEIPEDLEDEDNETKAYEQLFSVSKTKSSSQNEISPRSSDKEEERKIEGYASVGKAHMLLQKQLGPVKIKKNFSQEKDEALETSSNVNSKEISIQDLRNTSGTKPRVKIQIKTKRNPPPTPIINK